VKFSYRDGKAGQGEEGGVKREGLRGRGDSHKGWRGSGG
jgi:hypothetical protein